MKKKYQCINCGKESECYSSKKNKYCGNKCQQEFQYKTIIVPKIERGECTTILALKKYLKETLGDVCSICNISSVWNGKPLSLQLDHIDGNSDNNFPDNLRLLCPNCHTQTDTYGSKGNGSRYKKYTKRNSYLREYKQI